MKSTSDPLMRWPLSYVQGGYIFLFDPLILGQLFSTLWSLYPDTTIVMLLEKQERYQEEESKDSHHVISPTSPVIPLESSSREPFLLTK